mmetsp:Transcript_16151/g.34934  ORF Transcript_16151/g.34934 Transcript_16151/m.34934 type:complete len:234 (+) Transcript_16151:783-1484(+)
MLRDGLEGLRLRDRTGLQGPELQPRHVRHRGLRTPLADAQRLPNGGSGGGRLLLRSRLRGLRDDERGQVGWGDGCILHESRDEGIEALCRPRPRSHFSLVFGDIRFSFLAPVHSPIHLPLGRSSSDRMFRFRFLLRGDRLQLRGALLALPVVLHDGQGRGDSGLRGEVEREEDGRGGKTLQGTRVHRLLPRRRLGPPRHLQVRQRICEERLTDVEKSASSEYWLQVRPCCGLL